MASGANPEGDLSGDPSPVPTRSTGPRPPSPTPRHARISKAITARMFRMAPPMWLIQPRAQIAPLHLLPPPFPHLPPLTRYLDMPRFSTPLHLPPAVDWDAELASVSPEMHALHLKDVNTLAQVREGGPESGMTGSEAGHGGV